MSVGMAQGASVGTIGGGYGAAIGAVVGAVIGGATYTFDFYSNKHKLNDAIDDLEEKRDDYLNNLDNKFNIDKVNALNSANRLDATMDVQERRLDRGTNIELQALSDSQKQSALSVLGIATNNAQNKGANYSEIAASGTRGATTESAVDRANIVNIDGENKTAAVLAQETARADIDLQTRRLINSYMNNTQGIQENRTDAYEKRAMYAQKGDVYKGDMTYAATGNAYSAYRIQRDYDERQYNREIDKLKQQKKDMSSAWGFWSGFVTSVIGGSTSGISTGANIGTTAGYLWSNVGGKGV